LGKIPERASAVAEEIQAGKSSPLGATLSLKGANFSVYSKHATGIELLFFDCVDDGRPARVIRINPATNRTYHYWHVFVPGVKAGQIYGYRVEGPFDPASGMRFDSAKVLIVSYGRGTVVPKNYSREAARKEGDNAAVAMNGNASDDPAARTFYRNVRKSRGGPYHRPPGNLSTSQLRRSSIPLCLTALSIS